MAREPLELGGTVTPPGETRSIELSAPSLPTATELSMPVRVVHGRRPGPRLWLSAAIHGDELNGIEIIRQVLCHVSAERLRGSVVAIPIVNVFGFIHESRYFPDRRDLNRSFPGSARGSLASRVAHLFMKEIVANSTHGIDLHTAAQPRSNLPQIRANLEDPETRKCAIAFGAPIALHARLRDGSLRAAAQKHGLPVLLYEAGEAQRFDEGAIRVGVRGVLQVMSCLGMLPQRKKPKECREIATESSWVRARRGGILRLETDLGDHVRAKQVLGQIGTPLGEDLAEVVAPFDGMVIGITRNPLVYQGDGVVHVAQLPETDPDHGESRPRS